MPVRAAGQSRTPVHLEFVQPVQGSIALRHAGKRCKVEPRDQAGPGVIRPITQWGHTSMFEQDLQKACLKLGVGDGSYMLPVTSPNSAFEDQAGEESHRLTATSANNAVEEQASTATESCNSDEGHCGHITS